MCATVTCTDKIHNRIPPGKSQIQTFLMTISPVLSSAQDHQSCPDLSVKIADKPCEEDVCSSVSTTRISKFMDRLRSEINRDDDILQISRPPNCNQVLRCHTWHIQNGVSEHLLKWEAAKLVMAYLKTFHKPSMPMISKKKAQVLKSLKP